MVLAATLGPKLYTIPLGSVPPMNGVDHIFGQMSEEPGVTTATES